MKLVNTLGLSPSAMCLWVRVPRGALKLINMEDMTYVLMDNNEEIRAKIEQAGIHVCVCTKFRDACWLDYSTRVANGVHGIGYWGEEADTYSQEEALNLFKAECHNPYYCKDVDEFIAKIKESK